MSRATCKDCDAKLGAVPVCTRCGTSASEAAGGARTESPGERALGPDRRYTIRGCPCDDAFCAGCDDGDTSVSESYRIARNERGAGA